MRKILKILISIILISWFLVSYKGPRDFYFENNILPQKTIVIINAEKLKGTLYDPLMGKLNNLGGKMGFIVCTDIPNIAYGLSGFSIQKALEEDFQIHSEFYNTNNWNVRENPCFHRRVRNLVAYFKANDSFLSPDEIPDMGYLAFYKRKNSEKIVHVALVSAVLENTYKLIESAPGTILTSAVDKDSLTKRGWELVGFGRFVD